MHLSNSSKPSHHPLDPSKLPAFSMLQSYRLTRSERASQPASAPAPVILPSHASTPYQPPLPSFSTSFQTVFTSALPSIPASTTWIPSPPPAHAPLRLPSVAHVRTSQYHRPEAPSQPLTPSLYPPHFPPPSDLVLVSLPGVTPITTAAPLPPITLPPTSAPRPPPLPPPVLPAPAPHPATAPAAKPAPKRKKRPPSAKRSRSKTAPTRPAKKPATAATAKPSPPQHPSTPHPRAAPARLASRQPLVGAQCDATPPSKHRHPGALPPPRQSALPLANNPPAQTESLPSASVPAARDMPFIAPQPRQRAPGLNFADVVLEEPSYRADGARVRYDPWREGLRVREKLSSAHPATTQDSPRVYREAGETLDAENATKVASPISVNKNAGRSENRVKNGSGKRKDLPRSISATGSNRCSTEENLEKAVESLMTLAGSSLPSHNFNGDNSKSERGSHLINDGDCDNQTDNNFQNFPPQRDTSRRTPYSGTIPGPAPTTNVSPQRTHPECTESTPVDIRDSRKLFTRLPTTPLPNVSRNRSLTQQTPPLQQYLTSREHQSREGVMPHPSHSPPDLHNTLHRPSQVVRPLFQDQGFVQSSLNPSRRTPNFILLQNQPHQSQPNQPVHQPNTLPQAPQEHYPLPTAHPNFKPSDTVPEEHLVPPESLQLSHPTFERGRMPQRKKQSKNSTTKQSSKATKPAKSTEPAKVASKRSAKNPKPRRPRQPKKTASASPSAAADPVPAANATPPATGPAQSTTDANTTAAPSLRLHATLPPIDPVEPPTGSSLAVSTSNFHQQAAQELPSAGAQANLRAVHNLPPSWPPGHTVLAKNGASKPSQTPQRDAGTRPPASGTSKRMKPANLRLRKTPVNKSRASIEEALKAAQKAARNKQNALSVAKSPVVNNLQSQQPQTLANVPPPTPSEPSHPVVPRRGEQQTGFVTSEDQNRSHQTCDMHAQADGRSQPTTGVTRDQGAAGRLSATEKRIGNVLPCHLRVSTERTSEDRDSTSPRTESTLQTLHPETSSGGATDVENPSDSDDIPLAQTKMRMRVTSSTAPRAARAMVKPKAAKTKVQSGSQYVSPSRTSSVPTRTQSNAVFNNTYPGSQATVENNNPSFSRKRQNSSKNTDAKKRRKKNPNNPEQNASLNRKKSQKEKLVAPVTMEATQDAVLRNQIDAPSEAKTSTLVKKFLARGPTKSKVTRNATPLRKRASSTIKANSKERSKRSAPQSNESGVRPASLGTSNLRLCISVREKETRTALGTEPNQSGDAFGSPVTPDRQRNGFKYTSKPSQKTGGRVARGLLESRSNCEDSKIQTTPCFAEELENLRNSGILRANEATARPLSSESLVCSLSELEKVQCLMCQKHGLRSEMVKHPCFPVRAFDVCQSCSEVISKRVEEHGAKRESVAVPSEEAITQKTTLFVMLIEAMVIHFSASDREHRAIEQIYEFIKNRNFKEMVERAETLSVSLDMLTVLRVTLRKVGFTVRDGRLRWPTGEFTLPTFADTRDLISHALPARIDDLRKGILPGEAAWNETFGEDQTLSVLKSSCAMYEKVFSLIGLKLVHATTCNASDSPTSTCRVKFDAVSLGALMYRTAAMLSGTRTRELLAASWTQNEAFRFINETEIGQRNEPYEGIFESCCICGGSERAQESCSFRFSNCAECLRSFCSICLLNVLGTPEYLRSFGEGGYFCMMCRFEKNAELYPNGNPSRGEQDRRLRLHDIPGIKKRTERRMKWISLLLLSAPVRADVLRLASRATQKAIGVAKFCEVANENTVRNALGSQSSQAFHNMCLECKLPADGESQESSEAEVLQCGHEGCINVMHKTCLAPQRQARRRGSRCKWSCPHHQCSKCDQRDELKLLRCRTCPATYCKEHIPSPSEVFLFSERSFACSRCKDFLRFPQALRLKLQGSKSERKRNPFAQALAIDQRKRTAAVRKLSGGSGCFEGPPSFNEFRRELEMK